MMSAASSNAPRKKSPAAWALAAPVRRAPVGAGAESCVRAGRALASPVVTQPVAHNALSSNRGPKYIFLMSTLDVHHRGLFIFGVA
jgi:hypothetical protein